MLNNIKKIAQAILSNKIISKFLLYFRYVTLGLGSINLLTAYLYNIIYPFNFTREQLTILGGRFRNVKGKIRKKTTSPDLRRNIHRLEKGLSMPNRKPIFALNYIEETLDFFKIGINQDSIDHKFESELQWSNDVLKSYFSSIEHNSKTTNLQKVYEQLSARLKNKNSQTNKIPYSYSQLEESNISFDNLEKFFLRRRSVRFYEQKKVERNKIQKAITLAASSPSACNRIPYRYAIFDDPALIAKVASLPFGTTGYSNNIPCIIGIIGDFSNYFSARDKHVPYIDASLSVTTFMYACESLGLATCAINWPDFELLELKSRRVMKIGKHERIIMFVSCGYPLSDGMIPYSDKKNINRIISYNE